MNPAQVTVPDLDEAGLGRVSLIVSPDFAELTIDPPIFFVPGNLNFFFHTEHKLLSLLIF